MRTRSVNVATDSSRALCQHHETLKLKTVWGKTVCENALKQLPSKSLVGTNVEDVVLNVLKVEPSPVYLRFGKSTHVVAWSTGRSYLPKRQPGQKMLSATRQGFRF